MLTAPRLCRLPLLVALTATFGLSGCQTKPAPPPAPIVDPTIVAIEKAVSEIEKQHRMLASVERAQRDLKPLPKRPGSDVAPEMGTPIYLRNWHGPVSEVTGVIASLINYSFIKDGHLPAIEPMVTLDADGIPAFDALASLSDQGGKNYLIRVNIEEQTLTLIYQQEG